MKAPQAATPPFTRSRPAGIVAASVVACATVLLGLGCGGSSSKSTTESPADFVRRITTEFSRGQSGRLWDELLPADQRIVSRARFVGCQANEGWNLKAVKVIDAYDDPVAVGAKTLPSKAVSVRVTSDDGITTATMHAVSVNGKWRWVLQSSDRAAYATGKCPRTSG
jgi:hypothetical protein